MATAASPGSPWTAAPPWTPPEPHVYQDGMPSDICTFLQPDTTEKGRLVMFNRGRIGSPKTAFRTMVNAKTGEAIEVPDLDPSRGVYLVFSDPDTAVGCSPERGALAVYEPVG